MGQQPSFIHLRVHSAYSLSEGALPVKDLIKTAVTAKMPALGITDRNICSARSTFHKTPEGFFAPLAKGNLKPFRQGQADTVRIEVVQGNIAVIESIRILQHRGKSEKVDIPFG